jgi:hypothetical protein
MERLLQSVGAHAMETASSTAAGQAAPSVPAETPPAATERQASQLNGRLIDYRHTYPEPVYLYSD